MLLAFLPFAFILSAILVFISAFSMELIVHEFALIPAFFHFPPAFFTFSLFFILNKGTLISMKIFLVFIMPVTVEFSHQEFAPIMAGI